MATSLVSTPRGTRNPVIYLKWSALRKRLTTLSQKQVNNNKFFVFDNLSMYLQY